MKKTLFILLYVVAFTAMPTAGAEEIPPPRFMLGGIQVNESDQAAWAALMHARGYNTLQVTVYARQPQWNIDQLLVKPVDDGTVQKIRAARAAGLDVALILRIEIDHAYPENRFLWHGLISPAPAPGILDGWFDRYESFVLQWAAVAEREGVALLGLGSEMNAIAATRPLEKLPNLERFYLDDAQQTRRRELLLSQADTIPPDLIRAPGDALPVDNLRAFMEARDATLRGWAEAVTFAGRGLSDEERVILINARRARLLDRWEQMINETRAVYAGKLTYAANFDNYMDVAFWPSLDVMGINAYFPLRSPNEPATAEVLEAGWEKVFAEIESTQAELQLPGTGMPVVFTELGYTRRAGGTAAPWAWQGFELVGPDNTLMVWETRPMAPDERVRAIEALHAVNQRHGGLLAGLLYWKLTATPHHAEIEPFALFLPRDIAEPVADPLHSALRRCAEPPPAHSEPSR